MWVAPAPNRMEKPMASSDPRLIAVQVLQQLIFQDLPKEGITLSSTVTMSTDPAARASIASDPILVRGFGELHMGNLGDARAIASCRLEPFVGGAPHALVV